MHRKNRKRWIGILALILAIIMILSLTISMARADEVSTSSSGGEMQEEMTTQVLVPEPAGASSIANHGVYIDNVDVTGMTIGAAEKAVKEHFDDLKNETIRLYAGNHEVSVLASELGLDYTNKTVVEEALSIGQKGNVLKRFLAEREIRERGPIVLDLQLTVDEKKVANVLQGKGAQLNSDPKPNGLVLNDDNTFTVTPAEEGVQVVNASSTAAVVNYMENEWHGGEGGVALDIRTTPAEDTSQQLINVKNILGTTETVFDTTDEGRSTNIALAAENINGTVLYPGEEFSSVEAIGPTTEEEGFALGASYAGERIVESYGGGVCQVTSTLYGAVLEAELEVTERHNHTMPVHYVQPGFDATISEDDIDFRFINSTDTPIYLGSSVEEGTLRFTIYGLETRDPNRQIEYESREITKKDYTTSYVVAEDLPFGEIQEIYGEDGVQAELWKITYIDGETENEEKINISTYSPINHTYVVGAMGADEATRNSLYNAVGIKSLAAVNNAIGSGSTIESVEVQD